MQTGVPRWVCPACGVNNNLNAWHCWRCGVQREAWAEPPVTALAPRTDVCAILSVVFGAVSLFLLFLGGGPFSVAGLTLGLVSLARLRHNPLLTGRGLALTGLCLSALPLVVTLTLLWVIGQAASGAILTNLNRPVPQPLPDPPGSLSAPAGYRDYR